MKTIAIGDEYKEFIQKYADHFTLNGFSNLNKSDLSKASRNAFQLTGLQGEVAFSLYRYNSIDKLKSVLEKKVEVLVPLFGGENSRGDGGYDDHITKNGKTRFVDVKTSFVEDISKIKYLNLVIPEREYHTNMIYVAAFSIGKSRADVNEVILAGWAISEDVSKRWGIDPKKWCVPVNDLRPMSELEEFMR